MELLFRNANFKKLCSSGEEIIKKYGLENGNKLKQRLAELAAADNLEMIFNLRGPRLHPLKGDRNNHYAVNLKHPFRLIIKPADNPLPMKSNGTNIDFSKIQQVYILEVVDYHD